MGVGKNDVGQLAQGDTGNASYSSPVQICAGQSFKKVKVGEDYVMALTNSNEVYAWGSNSKGQVGNGTLSRVYTAEKVIFDLTNGEYISDIETGVYFAIALTNKGNVYAWGDNGSGALGQNNKASYLKPAKVKNITGITAIAGGKNFAIAIKNNGEAVYGWGFGRDGQLGFSATGSILLPREVTSLSNKGIKAVSCGNDFSVALGADGSVYTFGNNKYGQLGVYSGEAVEISSSMIKDIKWLNNYINSIPQPITGNITLPSTAPNGSSISWTSSHPGYISETGVVNRPDAYGADTEVELCAELNNNDKTCNTCYKVTVKQDPTIKPSTDIPIRSIGMEYDQIYPVSAPDVYPEITAVSMSAIDEANGVYQLTIRDDQYKCSNNSRPFFFWSARQGTFLPVDGYNDYRSVRFTIDPDALNKNVKVVVGIGDSLGYIDRKAVVINRGTETADVEASESNIMTLAENGELTESDITADESDTAVSLAIGIDTSANMQKFDQGASKNWMDSVEGLIESANTGVDTVLVTEDNFGYTKDAESAKASLDLIKTKEYSGSTDALSLLNRCDEALSDAENISQSGNKAAVVFVQNIGDISELKAKKEELENKGTAVYIMVLTSEDIDVSDDENICVCKTELDLRLKVSELYAAFGSIAEVMMMEENGSTNINIYTNSFKEGKHNFNVNSNNTFGINLATVLNIYGVLPAIASKNTESNNSYNLFGNLSDVYNLTQGNAYAMTAGNLTDMFAFYNDFESALMTSNNISSIISNNIKYRFPVIAKDNNGNYAIITGADGSNFKYGDSFDSNNIVRVMDTYEYLLQIANANQIVDNYSGTNTFYDKISFNTEDVQASDITVTGYGGTIIANNQISKSDGICTITGISTDDQILAGIKTTYDAQKLPNIYNSTKYYWVKQYADEKTANEWYYEYLFKATNLGIVNGDENLNFNAENTVTISEFLKMLIESAGIHESELIDAANRQDGNITGVIRGHWARKYICYGLDKNLITIGNVSGSNNPDTEVLRCDAAGMINRLYIDNINQPNLRVPSNLHKYSDNVSSDRNTLWKIGKAFKDQNKIVYCKDEIKQLYLNGTMDGNTEGYVNSEEKLKRSEASKMIIKCRFSLDEGIRNINIVNEGEANYIDLTLKDTYRITQLNDKSGSGEFYFVAPKTGYYYISNLENCTVTVSDMHKREIQGLDAYDSATQTTNGARYNILKGEKAYIKVTTTGSIYSFDISKPGENELVFAPDRSGTFIYDNCPEMLMEADLADAANGFGNVSLIEEDYLNGVVDIATSHLISGQCSANFNNKHISLDYLITNTSNEDIKVSIERIGIKDDNIPGDNLTRAEFAAFDAWCDYMSFDLIDTDKFIGNVYVKKKTDELNGEETYTNNLKYKEYIHKNQIYEINKRLNDRLEQLNGYAVLKPGQTIDLLNNYRPQYTKYSPYGQSTFVVSRIKIEGVNTANKGYAKLSSVAFYDWNNMVDTNGNIILPNKPNLRAGQESDNIDKAKGKAAALAETKTEVDWNISNTNNGYMPAKVFNLGNPLGVNIPAFQYAVISNNKVREESQDINELIDYRENTLRWSSYGSPTADMTAFAAGVYSDVPKFAFTDANGREWHFDARHSKPIFNESIATSGNRELTTADFNGGTYISDALSMGAFSTTETYTFHINNDTNSAKKISYIVRGGTPFFYRYSLDGGKTFTNGIKCNTGTDTTTNDNMLVAYELLNFNMAPDEKCNFILEIAIPNIGIGGFDNMLKAETL